MLLGGAGAHASVRGFICSEERNHVLNCLVNRPGPFPLVNSGSACRFGSVSDNGEHYRRVTIFRARPVTAVVRCRKVKLTSVDGGLLPFSDQKLERGTMRPRWPHNCLA